MTQQQVVETDVLTWADATASFHGSRLVTRLPPAPPVVRAG